MKPKFLKVGKMKVNLVWFDSLGAKSMCTFVCTPDIKILIDPGASIMQPSFPLSKRKKDILRRRALDTIEKFARNCEIIIITHYHYDHHFLPTKRKDFYRSKKIFIKDPNKWINRSQFFRARKFIKRLCKLRKINPQKIFTPPQKVEFIDPVENLKYPQVEKNIVVQGKRWLEDLHKLWSESLHIKENLEELNVCFADNKKVSFGNTKIVFSPPLFHGAEYQRLGWVIMVTIIYKNHKILFTSDIQGPIIKDYAYKIIDINPDLLIMDGPSTYLVGYLLSMKDLKRAKENLSLILRNTKTPLIIYDHHLTRDLDYKKKLEEEFEEAKNSNKKLLSAGEFLGIDLSGI